MHNNKYYELYQQLTCVKEGDNQAEHIFRQSGLLFNALGLTIQDFIKLVKPKRETAEIAVQYESLQQCMQNIEVEESKSYEVIGFASQQSNKLNEIVCIDLDEDEQELQQEIEVQKQSNQHQQKPIDSEQRRNGLPEIIELD